MVIRANCGAVDSSKGSHEDSWPCCMLPLGHDGNHYDFATSHSWDNDKLSTSELTPGGAVRAPKDGIPAHWFSIDRETLLALAETQAEGDTRYGIDNWRKGIPVSNLINHAMDHLSKALEGDSSEPHIQHAMWNLGKILWMAKNKPEMVNVPMIRKALKMEESK